jgi:hypothetical protein
VDIIISITGLPRTDKIVRSILNTFQQFQSFARSAIDELPRQGTDQRASQQQEANQSEKHPSQGQELGLIYNLNVVLPETTNVEVYNAIFRSLKVNMLR